MLAIVDAGPLHATVDVQDRHHARSLAAFQRRDLELIIPTLVIAEVFHFAGRRLGADVEARFVESLRGYRIEPSTPEDWRRIAQLVRQYGDFPLGTVDASIIALAERLQIRTVITLDRRHFLAMRPRHCATFSVLP